MLRTFDLKKSSLFLISLLVIMPTLGASQSSLRLTSTGTAKYSATISGDGSTAFWIEASGADQALRAINTDGSGGGTLLTSNSSTGVAGVTGTCRTRGGAGWPVVFNNYSLRVSSDGSKAVVLLSQYNGGETEYCFGYINAGSVKAIPLGLPYGIGGGAGVGIVDSYSFDISPDGATIVYSLASTSYQEDASAVVALNAASGSAVCLAGCFSRPAGDWQSVTYGSAPYHVGKPVFAGAYVAFAGSNTAAPINNYYTNLTSLFLLPAGGGSPQTIANGAVTGLTGVGGFVYYSPDSALGSFYSIAAASTFSMNTSSYSQTPFWDGTAGMVETAVGALSGRSELKITRPWGSDIQLTAGAGQVFGELAGISGESWRLAALDGSKVLYSMAWGSSPDFYQDLYVLSGLVGVQPTPTPTPTPEATTTPVVSPTLVPTVPSQPTAVPGSVKCSLSIEKKCKTPVRSGTRCRVTITGKTKPDGKALSGASYQIQKKKGKSWTILTAGGLNSKGLGTVPFPIYATTTFRAVLALYSCTTNKLKVQKK